MAQPDLRRLRDDAAEAVDRGKYKKARELYGQLAALDPADANWSRRGADMARKLGKDSEAIEDYLLAAAAYVHAGFVLQAVAMCKMALQLDPSHVAALRQLAHLQPAAPAAPSTRPTGVIEIPEAVGDAPSTPLGDVELRHAVPGARVEAPHIATSVVVLLDDEDLVEIVEPSAPAARAPSGTIAEGTRVGEALVMMTDAEEVAELRDATVGPPHPPPMLPPEGVDAAQLLREVPLFGALDAASLSRLALGAELIDAAPGQVLVKEGDLGDAMFVIVEGTVAVVSEVPSKLELARLGPGDFFGEIALMADVARSATVVATTPAQLLSISRQLIHQLVEAQTEVWAVLLRFLRGRLLDRLLRTTPLFGALAPEERTRLVHKFRFLEVAPQTDLLTQGQPTTGLHLLMAGAAEVLRDGAVVATLRAGDVFGEMGLLTNEAAGATVRAAKKCLLLQLSAGKFRQIIAAHPEVLATLSELADRRGGAARASVDSSGDGLPDIGRMALY